jgi:tetratricopeptide (TPR) repeat protein
MSPRSLLSLAAAVVVVCVAGATACSRSQPQPKQALGEPVAAQPSARDLLPEAARNALDAGNEAFRSKDYDKALKSYRDAANAAPENASAFYGIYMVAQKTGNAKLADSASKEIARRSPQAPMLTDSAMRAVHAPKEKGAE